jgi:abortive infection bacteriophage resistance protein
MSKPPTTFPEQLGILESRGLIIGDKDIALHALAHANYFRLSAYHPPFLIVGTDKFNPGTRFESIWELYRFDHRLRMLILDAIERCEISFRTRWAYEVAHRHGPNAYEDSTLYSDFATHAKALANVDEEIRRSREDFLNPYQLIGAKRPPTWIVCEVMSLGWLSSLFSKLKVPADRQAIADAYGLDERVLVSFLHHLSVVRNICAHHARLWNRRFTFQFQLPGKKTPSLVSSFNPAAPRQLYNTLVLLAYLLDIIEPDNHWKQRLMDLIKDQSFPVVSHMGFPPDWQSRNLWMKLPTV